MYFTAQNSKISPNFLMWKFCGNTELEFPQNFHTRQKGEPEKDQMSI